MSGPRTTTGQQLPVLIGNIRERAGLHRADDVYASSVADIEREAIVDWLASDHAKSVLSDWILDNIREIGTYDGLVFTEEGKANFAGVLLDVLHEAVTPTEQETPA